MVILGLLCPRIFASAYKLPPFMAKCDAALTRGFLILVTVQLGVYTGSTKRTTGAFLRFVTHVRPKIVHEINDIKEATPQKRQDLTFTPGRSSVQIADRPPLTNPCASNLVDRKSKDCGPCP